MKRIALLVSAALALATPLAHAVPSVGSEAPNVMLKDGWDRTAELARLRGKPILVVYEDKDSATLNKAFKDDLAALAAGGRYRARVALVAVADVSGYDYWPVRGIVKNAIQDESHKQKTTIYCDWDGSVRRRLGLERATSNVVLYGKDGRVLFARAGLLSAPERRQVIDLLRRQVDDQ